MTELILVRHGETAGNKRKNYIGRTDEPLSAEGAARISELVRQGVYPAADMLLASPMLRCRQTAQLIYPQLVPRLIDDLVECDFGEFENKNYLDLAENAAYQAWIDAGGLTAFPGGEGRAEFCARVCRGFVQAMRLILAAKPERAVIVAHGGTAMAVLSSYTNGSYYDFMTPNGGGWRLTVDEELWQAGHLPLPVPLI